MPNRAPLTLAALKRYGGLHSWPEAVAVVLEVSDQLVRAGETLITPDGDHIAFHDGRLIILPDAPIPPHPVRQAAQLLSDLLRGIPTPAELRELVAENMQDPPACAWIEEFMTALAYFDRPRRPQIVSTLAARAKLAQQAQDGSDIDSDDTSTTSNESLDNGTAEPSIAKSAQQPFTRWWRRLLGRDDTS